MGKDNYYSFKNLLLYFLKLGTIGFGGPIALVGYMERDLVQQRNWLTKEQYLRGLALAQLAPGPLAAQLAIYIGYLKGKIWGASLVAVAFILPSFIMVVALGFLYVTFGNLQWIQSLFYGIGAAVIGIIAKSAFNLSRRTLGKDILLWIIFIIMCLVTAITGSEIVLLFILSGIIVLFIKSPPKLFIKTLKVAAAPLVILLFSFPRNVLLKVFFYFAKASVFVFGSGLAIVPFLYDGVVNQFHWLNDRQFIDAVAVAMITPGPVVITVGFIGYIVAGFTGALAAAFGVFLPVYLFVIIPAPYFEKYSANVKLNAFVKGVTAAAIGAIVGAVYILGRRAIIDIPTFLIAAITLIVLIKFKIHEAVIITISGLVGILIFHFSHV